MRKAFGILFLTLACWITAAAPALAGDLKPAEDLQATAETARQERLPIMLMFEQSTCGACKTAKRDYLEPMSERGRFDGRVLLRIVTIDADQTLRDFDGEPISPQRLAERYDGQFTPTMVFVDADGAEVAEPVRGLRIPEFYKAYLNRGIDEALETVRGREQAAR